MPELKATMLVSSPATATLLPWETAVLLARCFQGDGGDAAKRWLRCCERVLPRKPPKRT
jgi:hypothetical protein